MINAFKAAVKRIFRYFGMEIHSHIPGASADAQIAATLKYFEIDLVLDIGANEGQFAKSIRSSGYSGDIVSFEPLTSAHSKLEIASSRDSRWRVYKRVAVGSLCGTTSINIAGNSASSSLLPMLKSHIDAAPHTAYIGSEDVDVVTIDSVFHEYESTHKRIFLKIDTQGFEWEVLTGSLESMPKITGVLLEMSLIPLYQGQHLWEETIARMKSLGFDLWALQPGFVDAKNGRTYQVDGIFFRNN